MARAAASGPGAHATGGMQPYLRSRIHQRWNHVAGVAVSVGDAHFLGQDRRQRDALEGFARRPRPREPRVAELAEVGDRVRCESSAASAARFPAKRSVLGPPPQLERTVRIQRLAERSALDALENSCNLLPLRVVERPRLRLFRPAPRPACQGRTRDHEGVTAAGATGVRRHPPIAGAPETWRRNSARLASRMRCWRDQLRIASRLASAVARASSSSRLDSATSRARSSRCCCDFRWLHSAQGMLRRTVRPGDDVPPLTGTSSSTSRGAGPDLLLGGIEVICSTCQARRP